MISRIFPLSVGFGLFLSLLAACNAAEEPTTYAPPVSAGESPVDGCALVTQEDASNLFGQPARPATGHTVVTMITQCLWTWDTDTSNQLLQFQIWDPKGYSMPEDAEPLAIGEGGYIRKHPVGGVDIAWLQNGQLISLAYSTVGPEAPKAMDRSEQMIELARQIESRH